MSYYKSICGTRYDDIVVDAESAEALLDRFCERLLETLEGEAPLHRVWYDLKAQALFEDVFQDDIAIIDDKLEDMVRRACNA